MQYLAEEAVQLRLDALIRRDEQQRADQDASKQRASSALDEAKQRLEEARRGV